MDANAHIAEHPQGMFLRGKLSCKRLQPAELDNYHSLIPTARMPTFKAFDETAFFQRSAAPPVEARTSIEHQGPSAKLAEEQPLCSSSEGDFDDQQPANSMKEASNHLAEIQAAVIDFAQSPIKKPIITVMQL
jgi:hypothetical protein